MKKLLSIILSVSILLLVGCTKPADTVIDEANTLGSVIYLSNEDCMAIEDGYVIYAFEYQDQYYRVTAPISEETEDEYMNIDVFDDDFNEKQEDIISPLKIEKKENLTEQILTESEKKTFIGKTGKELTDEGWSYAYNRNLETMEFYMYYGPFEYVVVFDGVVTESDYNGFDDASGTSDMKVKSIEFHGLGDAAKL